MLGSKGILTSLILDCSVLGTLVSEKCLINYNIRYRKKNNKKYEKSYFFAGKEAQFFTCSFYDATISRMRKWRKQK